MPKYTRNNSGHEESDHAQPMSQSSNFDGNEEAMSILLKAQATVAKSKKQKENQHLRDAKEEFQQLLGAGAQDYAALVGELEELCQNFQMKLAASHDQEGKYWAEAAAEQANFKKLLMQLVHDCQEEGETREKVHIDALALAHSGMNQAKSIVSRYMLF